MILAQENKDKENKINEPYIYNNKNKSLNEDLQFLKNIYPNEYYSENIKNILKGGNMKY